MIESEGIFPIPDEGQHEKNGRGRVSLCHDFFAAQRREKKKKNICPYPQKFS